MKEYKRGWLGGYFGLGNQIRPLGGDIELKSYVQEGIPILEIRGRSLPIRGSSECKGPIMGRRERSKAAGP